MTVSDHEALLSRISQLEEEVATLKEAFGYLAVCKRCDTRFAYFDWLVENRVLGERQVRFHVVLMTLALRVRGESLPDARKPIPGVSSELLYRDGPLTREQVAGVFMQVLDTENQAVVDALFRALKAQQMHTPLVAFWEASQTGDHDRHQV